MGGLRQAALRRSPTGFALPRPVYPSSRHLQSSIACIRRQPCHVPLERLSTRQRATHDDHFRRSIYPSFPDARAPEKICPNPPLRLYGQPSALDIIRSLSSTVGYGARRFIGNGFNSFGAVMSDLPGSINCGRETHCGSDYVAICFEMLFRYLVGETPNRQRYDVSLHACVDVSVYLRRASLSRPHFHQPLSRPRNSYPRIRLRRPLFTLAALRPVKTSTRIPVLSP